MVHLFTLSKKCIECYLPHTILDSGDTSREQRRQKYLCFCGAYVLNESFRQETELPLRERICNSLVLKQNLNHSSYLHLMLLFP